MSGKSWLPVGLAILVLTWVPTSHAAEKVKFVTSWVLYGADAYLFVAREKGIYRKAGFDVKISRGRGSGNTIREVSLRSFDFGYADAGTLVAARAKGAKVKEIAVMYSRAPHCIFVLKDSGIRKPKHLEGRTLATRQGGSTDRTFPAFASLAGFDASKVKIEHMKVPSALPSVLTGKVDGMHCYLTELPIMMTKAREHGREGKVLLWADYGFDIYSNGVIAHEDDIANKADRVRRFLKATVEGWAYGADHPEEAAKLFQKFSPESSPKLVLGQWKVAVDLSASSEGKKHGIGYILRNKMKTTRDIMFKALNLKGSVKVEDLYTNQFNPKIIPKSWR